ncbi:MAG: glycosyltransferase [Wenzhouxiangella sp.]|jgi:glycosyltransferase involved in cell wall biosynthesis|nr:glycosyltransferase [Wenzhouxiangella sp.]
MGLFPQPAASRDIAEAAAEVPASSGRGPIRLLLITDTDLAQRGGSERFLTHLLEGLDPTQFEIDLIQLDRSPSSHDHGGLLRSGSGNWRMEYRPVGAIYTPRAWRVWREVRARVRRGRYDIIQSQHEKADLLSALLPDGPNRPLRISNRRDTGFQKSWALRLLFLLLNHRYDLVVAPSQAILDQLVKREGVDRRRTRWLPNGVDCDRFQPIQREDRPEGRAQAGLPVDAYLIGCVARLVPVKRHEDLVAGFAMMAASHPRARLVLVGGGPLEETIRRQVNQLGLGERVQFMGEGRNMERLLPLFDAFVLASSTEGMSNAILEAMACALPVIATHVGGNPELVQPGLTGYLVPPLQPGQLARAMSDLVERPDQGERMGRAARQRARMAFSLPTMIALFSSFYRGGRETVRA